MSNKATTQFTRNVRTQTSFRTCHFTQGKWRVATVSRLLSVARMMHGFILYEYEYCWAKYCHYSFITYWKIPLRYTWSLTTTDQRIKHRWGNCRTAVRKLFGPWRDGIKIENYTTKIHVLYPSHNSVRMTKSEQQVHAKRKGEMRNRKTLCRNRPKWKNPLQWPMHCLCALTVRNILNH